MDRPGISLDEWYPLIKGHVPTPRTGIVRYNGASLIDLLEGGHDDETGLLGLADHLRLRAEEEGIIFPAFLRNGLTSGKHDWLDTCFVPGPADLTQHIMAIVESAELHDMFGGLQSNVWVIREMLPTAPAFYAFRHMPITKERRYFVEDGRVVGHQPYWPPGAFEHQQPYVQLGDRMPGVLVDRDWRAMLDALNACDDGEHRYLTDLSTRVAKLVPGAWSVDWLFVPARGWLLTDMAHAEVSYVWGDHPHIGEAAKWAPRPEDDPFAQMFAEVQAQGD